MQSKSNRKMFNFINKTIATIRGTDSRASDSSTSGYSSSEDHHSQKTSRRKKGISTKYPYGRPSFLEIVTEEEMTLTLDHTERKICVPKRMSSLPLHFGYSECTNAGKSKCNEDQAVAVHLKLQSSLMNSQRSSTEIDWDGATIEPQPVTELASESSTNLVDIALYGVFDGHAGPDVAVTVSHELPFRIKERLMDVIDELKAAALPGACDRLVEQCRVDPVRIKRKMSMDDLITGALQAAFHDMDSNLVQDKAQYTVKGGCTAVVSLFFAGKLYVANAGDSGAVMKRNRKPVPLSHDCTPETERKRLQLVAEEHPELLGDEFRSRQFSQRITRKDLGTRMFYRDSRMDGWANKVVTEEDLRFPMIIGEGRRARLLATIGVTRGFGDHDLKVFDSQIYIKPFLTPSPEVKIFDMNKDELGVNDVVIMATDGLWDAVTDQEAVDIVDHTLADLPSSDASRYNAAAVALIMRARGQQKSDHRSDAWFMDNEYQEYASHDDISCIVIPLRLQQNFATAPTAINGATFDAGAWTLRRKNSNETNFTDASEDLSLAVAKSINSPSTSLKDENTVSQDISAQATFVKSKESSNNTCTIGKSSCSSKEVISSAPNGDPSDKRSSSHSNTASESGTGHESYTENVVSEDDKTTPDSCVSGVSVRCDISSD